MVEHERTGLLAPVSAEGMTQAVGRLLGDSDLAARLSATAADTVKRDADPAAMARRIEALYEHDAEAS